MIRLPPEILHLICSELSGNDLLTLRLVHSVLCAAASPLAAADVTFRFYSDAQLVDYSDYAESMPQRAMPLQNLWFSWPTPDPALIARLCRVLPSWRRLLLEHDHSDNGSAELNRNESAIIDQEDNFDARFARDVTIALQALPSLEYLEHRCQSRSRIIPDLDLILPVQLRILILGDVFSDRAGVDALRNILRRLPMLEQLHMKIQGGRMEGDQHLVTWMAENTDQLVSTHDHLGELKLTIVGFDDGGALYPFVLLVYLMATLRLQALFLKVEYMRTQQGGHPPRLFPLPSSVAVHCPTYLQFVALGPHPDPPPIANVAPFFSGLTPQGVTRHLRVEPCFVDTTLKLLPTSSIVDLSMFSNSILHFHRAYNHWSCDIASILVQVPHLVQLSIFADHFHPYEFMDLARQGWQFQLSSLELSLLTVYCFSTLESLAACCLKLRNISISILRATVTSYTPCPLNNEWMPVLRSLFGATVPWMSLPLPNVTLKYRLEGARNSETRMYELVIVLQYQDDDEVDALKPPPLQFYLRMVDWQSVTNERMQESDSKWLEHQLCHWHNARAANSAYQLEAPSYFPSEMAERAWMCISMKKMMVISCISLKALQDLSS